MDVRGSIVFVTGANRGLGLAFARAALSRGAAKVYAGTRDISKFSEPDLIPVQIDVTEPHSVAAAAARCKDVNILVNNAGIAGIVENPLHGDVETLSRRLFETNYYGVVRVTQAFAPILAQSAQSAIINVLSDVTWLPIGVLGPYAATKAAAWTFTNNTRLHLKGQHTQVVGLHCGFIDTDLTKGLDVPKTPAPEVVRQTYDALEAGESEIMADTGTVALKGSLSDRIPGYIDPSRLA